MIGIILAGLLSINDKPTVEETCYAASSIYKSFYQISLKGYTLKQAYEMAEMFYVGGSSEGLIVIKGIISKSFIDVFNEVDVVKESGVFYNKCIKENASEKDLIDNSKPKYLI